MAALDVIGSPLWEPDPRWSKERVEAFCLYRDMGAERSQERVGESLSKSRQLMSRWAAEDKWTLRVAAYDAELDRIRREAHSSEIEEVSRRHARSLEAAIEVMAAPALELARRMREDETKIDAETSAYELAAATERAAKVLPSLIQASRLVHGLATEKVDTSVTFRKKIENADIGDLDRMLTGVSDDGAEIIEGEAVEIDPDL